MAQLRGPPPTYGKKKVVVDPCNRVRTLLAASSPILYASLRNRRAPSPSHEHVFDPTGAAPREVASRISITRDPARRFRHPRPFRRSPPQAAPLEPCCSPQQNNTDGSAYTSFRNPKRYGIRPVVMSSIEGGHAHAPSAGGGGGGGFDLLRRATQAMMSKYVVSSLARHQHLCSLPHKPPLILICYTCMEFERTQQKKEEEDRRENLHGTQMPLTRHGCTTSECRCCRFLAEASRVVAKARVSESCLSNTSCPSCL